MVSERIIGSMVLFIGLILGTNNLTAQKDVLLPYMKTDQFYLGEKIVKNDKRFRELNADMGLYQPEIVPLNFMGIVIDEALVSIESGQISRIVLFVNPKQTESHAKNVIDSQLSKLVLKKGEDGVDHFWRTTQYEIVLQQGIDGNVIYLQPLSAGSEEDPNPESAD